MKNLNEFRQKLIASHDGHIQRCSWTDIYDTEEELIEDLKSIKIVDYGVRVTVGHVYLASFQKRLIAGKDLTDKQMVQLKRLATSVAYEKYIVSGR